MGRLQRLRPAAKWRCSFVVEPESNAPIFSKARRSPTTAGWTYKFEERRAAAAGGHVDHSPHGLWPAILGKLCAIVGGERSILLDAPYVGSGVVDSTGRGTQTGGDGRP